MNLRYVIPYFLANLLRFVFFYCYLKPFLDSLALLCLCFIYYTLSNCVLYFILILYAYIMFLQFPLSPPRIFLPTLHRQVIIIWVI